MKLDGFGSERESRWGELDTLLIRARRRPERLSPSEILRLGQLYRGAAADLALARRRFAGSPELARLEELVGRARYVVYDSERGQGTLLAFARRGYWRRVAERPALLAIAALLLFLPMGLGAIWAARDPVSAAGVLPAELEAPRDRPSSVGDDLGFSAASQAAFASGIFTNNIQVSFLAFAGGAIAGLGTALVLLYNGVILGVVSGLVVGAGYAGRFAELVLPHGGLELSCIVVSAAAGLRVGWALIDPGYERRATAFVREARSAIEIALGTIPFLVIAGLVEGFVTPKGVGIPAAIGLGLGLAIVYWAAVLRLGAPSRSQSGALLAPQVRPDTRRAEPTV